MDGRIFTSESLEAHHLLISFYGNYSVRCLLSALPRGSVRKPSRFRCVSDLDESKSRVLELERI